MNTPTIASSLRCLGVSRESIGRLTGPGNDLRTPLHPTREALHSDDPLAIAVRLLFCRVAVERMEAVTALDEDLLAQLLAAGIVRIKADHLVAPYHLRLVQDLFLFSDYLGHDAPENAVMGAGETTAVLYGAARPERKLGVALDLGCGAGTLALLLARDSERVVGTDVNPRAIELARLNAQVNGITNAEFRTGSLWEPVAGERFDWIVSQPPYYPLRATPGEWTFLHGGVRGDEVALCIVNGLHKHLAPDGRAVVFTSWPEDRDERIAAGMQVLELTANRREPTGSRQSIDVIEHAGANGSWFLQTEVSTECWGDVRPRHIDRLIANGHLLNGASGLTQGLLNARLHLAPDLALAEESGRCLLTGSTGALLRFVPLDDEMARALAQPGHGSEKATREALRRGWLCEN